MAYLELAMMTPIDSRHVNSQDANQTISLILLRESHAAAPPSHGSTTLWGTENGSDSKRTVAACAGVLSQGEQRPGPDPMSWTIFRELAFLLHRQRAGFEPVVCLAWIHIQTRRCCMCDDVRRARPSWG